MSSAKRVFVYLGFLWTFATTAVAQLTMVSSATFTSGVAPGSIASIFGSNMAIQQSSAVLDQSGNLPTTIDSTSVTVNGKAARLFFVSPGQINLVIPDDTPTGTVNIAVSNGGAVQTGTAQVQLTAAGVFTIVCFRSDRAAAQNAITGQLDPFQSTTPENPGSDKRTILSFYGTGIRFAGNAGRVANVNATSQVTAQFTDSNGNTYTGDVFYAGKQPTLAGLDQVNIALPATLSGLGTVGVTLNVAGQVTKSVSIVMTARASSNVQSPNYNISTVVGPSTGAGAIVAAQLQNPRGVALDANHNLYIADSDNHLVRRVTAAGVITTYAGTGTAGSTGDGGLAISAQLRRPTALAVDKQGSLYIVDTDDNRVRKVTTGGVITSLAGNGTAGFSGDGAPAAGASLKAPQGIAVNPYGTVIIADTGNDRVRRVTADGLISTIAGGGGSAAANVAYNAAYLATLKAPTDIAVDSQGTVFIADAGNFIIRRVGIDGAIFTIGGTGTSGSTGTNCPALQASFGSTVRLAIDAAGKLLVADTANQRIRLIDSTCYITDAAGTGAAGFSGDGGAALQSQLNTPSGIAVDSAGDVYFADTANQRIRRLSTNSGITVVVTPPNGNGAGLPIAVDVSLGGNPPPTDTTIQISSSIPIPGLPSTITIPAGQTAAVITATTPVVSATVPVTITASTGGVSATGSVTVTPGNGTGGGGGGGTGTGGGNGAPTLSVVLAPGTILSGTPTVGRVVVNTPAPAGGTTVQLNSNSSLATVAASVTIPQGQTSAEFAIGTVASLLPVNVTIAAAAGGVNATGMLSLGAASTGGGTSGGAQVPLGSVSVSPSTIAAGQSATGTVTLASPAPTGGAQVTVSSSIPGVTVPGSITIPAGQTTGTFSVQAPAVGAAASGTVSATSANTVTTPISVGSGTGGPSGATQVPLGSVSVSPSIIAAGQSATGTVTLASPAPTGGALVTVSSSIPGVVVPGSITIPAGQTTGTFSVQAPALAVAASGTVSATSANTVTTPISVSVGTGGGTPLPSIVNVAVNSGALTGGQSTTGTVTISGAAPAGGLAVQLASNNPAVSVPASVTIPAGQTSATFSVGTSPVAANVAATVSAAGGSGGGASTSVGVNAPCISGLSASANIGNILTGQGLLSANVTLNGPAASGGVSVDLKAGGATVGTVVVPSGQTSGSASINLANLLALKGTSLTASTGSCGIISATIN